MGFSMFLLHSPVWEVPAHIRHRRVLSPWSCPTSNDRLLMLVAVLGWRVLASPGPAAVLGTWVSGVYNFSASSLSLSWKSNFSFYWCMYLCVCLCLGCMVLDRREIPSPPLGLADSSSFSLYDLRPGQMSPSGSWWLLLCMKRVFRPGLGFIPTYPQEVFLRLLPASVFFITPGRGPWQRNRVWE